MDPRGPVGRAQSRQLSEQCSLLAACSRAGTFVGAAGCGRVPRVCATVRVLARAHGLRGRTCALPPRVLVFVRTRVRACVSTHSCAGACMRMDGYVIRRSPSVQSVLNVVTESLESYFYIQVHS
jgi:hypothetical protein